jgi:hypothetical protein
MTTTTSYGTLTRHADGKPLGPATAAEWRKGADAIASGNAEGTFRDESGTGEVVWVDGGPRAEVDDDDIRKLEAEAGQRGDLEQVDDCRTALSGGYMAREACVSVILGNRVESLH